MILKKDDLRLGLIIGLIAPLLGLLILYFIKFSAFSFGEFLDYFLHEKRLITSLGSLCLLANVVFFTIYINSHRDKTARGIFLTTCIYGIAILLIKVIN
ncbi:MAG: hypothetical protein ICV66_05290 [Chitinophagaceae bacterium]|nr:hypothetical protein [Chitinophagaceae bacterium]